MTARPGWWPHALVAAWLVFLGAALWLRVAHSVQPPLYDPQSYLLKAIHFWHALERGAWIEALKVEPTVRPLGTVVLTAPFGFTPDFRGYHFRSVFLPVALVIAAVYVAAGRAAAIERPWAVAGSALLLSSLPMFYHLDWTEATPAPTRWGLVDGFQAGVAALALATLLSSVRALSVKRFAAALALGVLALLVKPSGLMVLALMAALWMLLAVHAAFGPTGAPMPTLGYGFGCTLVVLAMAAAVAAYCFWSGYFSPDNMAYAKQALRVMRRELDVTPSQLATLLHASAGVALPLWLVVVAALALRRAPSRRSPPAWLLLLGAAAIWLGGAWFWLVVQAGGNQVRYFFPFLLMGAVALVPVALRAWERANRGARAVLVAIMLLPAANAGLLLASGDDPPHAWQRASGVSLTVGGDAAEVRQANELLLALRAAGRDAALYSFTSGVASSVFENVGMYEALVRPGQPTFAIAHPLDWVDGFGVRTEQLVGAGYILVRKAPPQEADRYATLARLESFDDERHAFQAWLAAQGTQAGLEVASDGPRLRLLRVADREALRRAVDGFVRSRQWRPEFVRLNAGASWQGGGLPSEAADIAFGGVYRVERVEARRDAGGTHITVVWRELRADPANAGRHLFLHLVDRAGAIVQNRQLDLSPPGMAANGARRGSVSFPRMEPERAVALAFGVYHDDGSYLLPDRGVTDWNGKRVILPLEQQP